MKRILLVLLLISSAAHAKDECWENPWVDTPNVNMPLLIKQGYEIKQHSFGTVLIGKTIVTGNDYILQKTETSASCAGNGLFSFSFLCKKKVTHAKVYECEIDEAANSSGKHAVHMCQVLRDADKIRRAPCDADRSKGQP